MSGLGSSAAIIIAITELIRLGSQALKEFQSDDITPEELASRWLTIQSGIAAANAQWEASKKLRAEIS